MKRRYDAVMVSTGPSLKVDRKRVDDAIAEIERIYGSLQSYNGLWIAAGTLGNQNPETAQRTRIYNRFLEVGIEEDRIRTIGGVDTMDKIRKMLALADEEKLRTIGISTYALHFLRYDLGLQFAKTENPSANNLEFKLIHSLTTPVTRWPKDIIYGLAGLGIEIFRLERNGFLGATPDYKPGGKFWNRIKELASDRTGIESENGPGRN